MKILALTHYYIEDNRAGGEMMIHALLKSLADAGHDVTALITDTTRPNIVIDGVKVIYGVDKGRVLDTYEYDALVTQFQSFPIAMQHTIKTGKPLIHVVHNDMVLTLRYIQQMPRGLTVYNSNWIQNKTRLYARNRPSVVVHPPIDREAFKTTSTKEYVTLVNITREKGSDVFYELARRMPDVKFLGVLGGYWKSRQIILDLPNVTILENTPNMKEDVYAKTKIILMPSTYESFGMVAAEAIVSGIPVICTPTLGLKENLGDAGIYSRFGNTPEYETTIRKLVSDDEYYNIVSKACEERSKVIDTKQELQEFVKKVEGL